MMLDEAFPPQIDSLLKLSDGLYRDLSGKGNIVYNNAVVLTADHRGRVNKGWKTLTNRACISTPLIPQSTNEYTVNMGMKYRTSLTTTTVWRWRGNIWIMLVSPVGSLHIYVRRPDSSYIVYEPINYILQPNSDYFITWIVKSMAYIKVLVNLTEVYNFNLTEVVAGNTEKVTLVGDDGGDNRYFDSDIDYFDMYNRALPIEEITQLYNEWRK